MYYNTTAAIFEDSAVASEYQFKLCNTTDELFWYFSSSKKTPVLVGVGQKKNSSIETLVVSRDDCEPDSTDKNVMALIICEFVYSESFKEHIDEIQICIDDLNSMKVDSIQLNSCQIKLSIEGRGGYECNKPVLQ